MMHPKTYDSQDTFHLSCHLRAWWQRTAVMTCHVISTHPMALDDLETFIAFPEGSGLVFMGAFGASSPQTTKVVFLFRLKNPAFFFQEILEVGMVVNNSLVSETNNKRTCKLMVAIPLRKAYFQAFILGLGNAFPACSCQMGHLPMGSLIPTNKG